MLADFSYVGKLYLYLLSFSIFVFFTFFNNLSWFLGAHIFTLNPASFEDKNQHNIDVIEGKIDFTVITASSVPVNSKHGKYTRTLIFTKQRCKCVENAPRKN